jgi:hypothetical protein
LRTDFSGKTTGVGGRLNAGRPVISPTDVTDIAVFRLSDLIAAIELCRAASVNTCAMEWPTGKKSSTARLPIPLTKWTLCWIGPSPTLASHNSL